MKKVNFTGGFGEFFLMSLGLLVLTGLTFGLLMPYFLYWTKKYFYSKLEIDGKRIKFTGGFGSYFLMSLGLMVLTILTFGLALPYWMYKSFQYFAAHLELEE